MRQEYKVNIAARKLYIRCLNVSPLGKNITRSLYGFVFGWPDPNTVSTNQSMRCIQVFYNVICQLSPSVTVYQLQTQFHQVCC